MNGPDGTKTEHGTLDGTASYWEFGHDNPFKLRNDIRTETRLSCLKNDNAQARVNAGRRQRAPLEESENDKR